LNTIITEETEYGEVPVDIYQRLADDRVLFISNFIDDKLATDITATLLLKDLENPGEKITLFINSEGGDIRNIFMIYDMMSYIESPVETVCIGSAMNEAALLLTAGTPGMRYATKNSVIVVSQLVNDFVNYSDLTDAKMALSQVVQDNKKMLEIFSKSTKKPIKKITEDFDRQVYLSATQAVKYKIIDKVIPVRKK